MHIKHKIALNEVSFKTIKKVNYLSLIINCLVFDKKYDFSFDSNIFFNYTIMLLFHTVERVKYIS